MILSPGLPAELANFIAAQSPLRGQRVTYDFASEDEFWIVSLGKDSLALTCKKYERWEGFKRRLEGPLAALCTEYRPAFFSRIGLRYRNVIRRSALDLENANWASLLKPYLAGELSDPQVSDSVLHLAREAVIRLSEKGAVVRILHGFAEDDKSKEQLFLIDADFFVEQRTETKDAVNRLDYLKQQAGRLFRWCITDRLHDAMQPRPL